MLANLYFTSKTMKLGLINRWKTFSMLTSMQGFNEMQTSKSKICSIFWLILILFSISITTNGIIKSIQQFVNQVEVVSVRRLQQNDQVMYPHVTVCYQHWLYWARIEKALELGFTKESVLFGLSYLTEIFSTTPFNKTEAEADFTNSMKANNMTTLSQFYKILARQSPEWEKRLNYSQRNSYFENAHFRLTTDDLIVYCYNIEGKHLVRNMDKQEMTKQKNKDHILDEAEKKFSMYLSTDYDDIDKILTNPEEYKYYISKYVQMYGRRFVDYNKLANLEPYSPRIWLLLYTEADTEKPIEIQTDCTNMFIGVLIKVYEHRNSSHQPCIENVMHTTWNSDKCQLLCLTKYQSTKCLCPQINYMEYANLDYPKNMCRQKITFLSEANISSLLTHESDADAHIDQFSLSNKNLSITCNNGTWVRFGKSLCCKEADFEYDKKTDACLDACKIRGCITWLYKTIIDEQSLPDDFNYVTKRHANKVTLYFPMVYEVEYAQMVYMQTLDNLIANVGGLMGVWIGASVMSIFQLAFLCCCFEDRPKQGVVAKAAEKSITACSKF